MNITFSILHSLADQRGLSRELKTCEIKKNPRQRKSLYPLHMLDLFQIILKENLSSDQRKINQCHFCLLDIPIFKRDCEHRETRSIFDVFFFYIPIRPSVVPMRRQEKKLFTLKRVHRICLPFVIETYTHVLSLFFFFFLPEINLLLIIASTYSHSMLFFLSVISFGLSH